MTDKEIFIDMLQRNGIGFDEKPGTLAQLAIEPRNRKTSAVELEVDMPGVDGYSGFVTTFHFDPVTSALIKVTVYD